MEKHTQLHQDVDQYSFQTQAKTTFLILIWDAFHLSAWKILTSTYCQMGVLQFVILAKIFPLWLL